MTRLLLPRLEFRPRHSVYFFFRPFLSLCFFISFFFLNLRHLGPGNRTLPPTVLSSFSSSSSSFFLLLLFLRFLLLVLLFGALVICLFGFFFPRLGSLFPPPTFDGWRHARLGPVRLLFLTFFGFFLFFFLLNFCPISAGGLIGRPIRRRRRRKRPRLSFVSLVFFSYFVVLVLLLRYGRPSSLSGRRRPGVMRNLMRFHFTLFFFRAPV